MRSAACVLLLVSVAGAQSVEVTIVSSVTGAGIPGARVVLMPGSEHTSQLPYSGTADSEGRFRIDGVKEGSYRPIYSAEHHYSPNGVTLGPEFLVAAADSVVRIWG